MKATRTLLALVLCTLALVALPAPAAQTAITPAVAAEAAPESAESADTAQIAVVTEADLFLSPTPLSSSVDADLLAPLFGGSDCNEVVCGKGYVCCSYSCSLCGPAGGACPDVMCP